MSKKERDWQSKFNQWLRNVHKRTGAFELKRAVNDSLPFDAVVPHQVEALQAAANGVLVYKIPDAGYQNPFDCFCLAGVPGYVVIKYDHGFELITIDTFLLEKSRSKRKSLTASRAREISTISI